MIEDYIFFYVMEDYFMASIEDLQKEELMNLEVEEVNLEDLIVLGTDKLINISITYPEEKDGTIKLIKTKAKIKQLSMRQLRNIDFNNINLETVVSILTKALFKQDETAFSKNLILDLPIGVCFAITREIMKISGVDENQLWF